MRTIRRITVALCMACLFMFVCTASWAAGGSISVNPDLDLSKYLGVTHAREVTVTRLELDERKALDALMDGRYERIDRTDAAGRWLATGPEAEARRLCVFDDGNSFGMSHSGFESGLSYYDESCESLIRCVEEVLCTEPYFTTDRQRELFAARDLGFMRLDDARQLVLDKLAAIGIRDVRIECEYALTKDDVRSELTRLSKEKLLHPKELEEICPAAEDCYVFRMRQEFCGVPYSSYMHQGHIDRKWKAYKTEGAWMEICVSASGINSMYGQSLRRAVDMSEPREIISAEAALVRILDAYDSSAARALAVSGTRTLRDMELTYYYKNIAGIQQLCPVWAFSVEIADEWERSTLECGFMDAFTGEIALV